MSYHWIYYTPETICFQTTCTPSSNKTNYSRGNVNLNFVIFLPWPPPSFDDTMPHVFPGDSCCCLAGCVCVCPEFCDCGWGCWTCCGWDGGGIGRCGCNSGGWEVGTFVCDGVELGGTVWEVVAGGVSEGFSFALPHPPPPLGTKETVGSLPEFSLFKDGRFAGGGIRRLAPTFPRLCSPWRAVPIIQQCLIQDKNPNYSFHVPKSYVSRSVHETGSRVWNTRRSQL